MPTLILEGTGGATKGLRFRLPEGEALVGRSRSCEASLYPVSASCRSVSKRHVVLRLDAAGRLAIEDLSQYGTFLDGDRIETVILTDLAHRSHTLRLGRGAAFRLSLERGP